MANNRDDSLNLSIFGVGCWPFGGGDYWGDQSQKDVDDLVAAALDRGITFFDTAEAYNGGKSEESLGKALGRRRGEAIIGTKVVPENAGKASMIASCEASLRRLGTDVIDVYMLHWPLGTSLAAVEVGEAGGSPRVDETAEAFATLIRDGKIRFAGVSNHGPRWITEILNAGITPAVNQVHYSLLSRAAEIDVAPACRDHGIAVIGYMPLMQGFLTGKYRSIEDAPPNRTRTRHFSGDRTGSRHGGPGFEGLLWRTIRAVEEIAASRGVAVSAAALAWCVSGRGATTEIFGARSVAQLERNADAASLLGDREMMEELDEASRELQEAMGPGIDYWESPEKDRSR